MYRSTVQIIITRASKNDRYLIIGSDSKLQTKTVILTYYIILLLNFIITKYLIISHQREHVQVSLVVGDLSFDKVSEFKMFKYLRVDISKQENSHEEINREYNGRI